MNEGKAFEKDIKDSAKFQNIFVMRLNDTYLSWKKMDAGEFAPRNICDFVIFKKPDMFLVECKSTKYQSMSIQIDPEEDDNKMIKYHQIKSLADNNHFDGIHAGFILNFRDDEDIDNNYTYWLPIEGMSRFLNNTDKKSINKLDIVQYGGWRINQTLKRKHYLYDIDKMLGEIVKKEAIKNA